MNVSSNFINEVVVSFFNDLNENGFRCDRCQSNFSISSYKSPAYQKLYALRYLPAYYFEYCVLASRLNERVRGDYDNLNIVSFGCGLSPDYYALKDNLNEVNFSYTGIDAVQWSSQQLMPKRGDNYRFEMKNAATVPDDLIENADVFIFPKSIGDIDGSVGIDGLASRIGSLGKNRIFFLNSFVTKSFNNPVDVSVFGKIHNSLCEAGYSTNDDHRTSYHLSESSANVGVIGLRKIHWDFIYPSGFDISCNDENSQEIECQNCMVPKKPIYTNQYMAFSILEYVR